MVGVVDASVALTWCWPDQASPETERLLDAIGKDEALVPAIWSWEVSNALLTTERHRKATEAETAKYFDFLFTLPIVIDGPTTTRVVQASLGLGRTYGLTSYDAAYLELAERSGLPLATLDSQLRKAARTAGVALIEVG